MAFAEGALLWHGQQMLTAFAWLSDAFSDGKTLLEYSLGFDNDALHVLVGVGLQIAFALFLRRSIADWPPLTILLFLELGNEANDLFHEVWPDPSMQMVEGLKDFLLTMLVPTVFALLVRSMPRLFVRIQQGGGK